MDKLNGQTALDESTYFIAYSGQISNQNTLQESSVIWRHLQ